MTAPITRSQDWRGTYDTIIDVRTPSEYADDHIPGAVNLPVLSCAERAEVGVLYKQVSAFHARKRGAALISRNLAAHLEGGLADKEVGWSPLIYCWRGGQRSGAAARVLAEIGWQVAVLDGGYKRYRREVLAGLEALEAADAADDKRETRETGAIKEKNVQDAKGAEGAQGAKSDDGETGAKAKKRLRLVVLEGATGVGKSAILAEYQRLGGQAIDLEGLSCHRGSLLGGDPHRTQPSQCRFESALFAVVSGLDATKPVLIEGESSRLGQLHVPPALWRLMGRAGRIRLTADLAGRVEYIVAEYQHLTEVAGAGAGAGDEDVVSRLIAMLADRHSKKAIAELRECLAGGDWRELVAGLLRLHYDPAYAHAAGRHAGGVLGEIAVPGLNPAGFQSVAKHIRDMLGEADAV